jgi:hypothetical protein
MKHSIKTLHCLSDQLRSQKSSKQVVENLQETCRDNENIALSIRPVEK